MSYINHNQGSYWLMVVDCPLRVGTITIISGDHPPFLMIDHLPDMDILLSLPGLGEASMPGTQLVCDARMVVVVAVATAATNSSRSGIK